MSENRKCILFVDDDEDFRVMHKGKLEAAGYEVLEADGCASATALLSDRRPDLAVMDLIMEEKDSGFTLSYRIKKLDPTIPIIMVTTANSISGMDFDAETPEERVWIKAERLLSKPLRTEQLAAEIESLLEN